MASPVEPLDPRSASDMLGHWWLPEAPDRRVAGRLLFPADGPIALELMDVLSGGLPDQVYRSVTGITTDGTAMTLEGLTWIGGHDVNSVFLPEQHRRETFMLEVAYVGAHLPEPEDRLFAEGVVDFTDLLAWAGRSGLDEKYGPAPISVTIQVTTPPEREVHLDFGTVTLAHGWRVTGDALRSRGIDKSAGLWVKLAQPAPLKEWPSVVIGPLRHLLTFATDRQNELRDLSLTTHRGDAHPGHQVTVRYAHGHADEATPAERLSFLFDAERLGDDFEVVLRLWFDLIADIGPIIDLLLAQRYRPKVYAETRFLDAVAAAEAYHRARIANESMPQAEHQLRVATILGAVPAAHRSWLTGRLEHSNEPRLRDRLIDLRARTPLALQMIAPETADWADAIARTRNAMVHDPRRRRTMRVSGRELLKWTEQLTLLVTTALLRELGFDDDGVMAAVRPSRRFRLLTEVLRD
jgi:hypothetical protein